MTKAIISNRIYIKLPSNTDITKKIMSELTYKFKKKTINPNIPTKLEIVKNYKLINPDIIAIPQGRQDLIPQGYSLEDRRVTSVVPFPTPKFPLREDQLDQYNLIDDSCFLNAPPGWGKTFTALHLAAKLGQKTLVVTHNTNLRDQWIKDAERLFNYPVGIIGSGKFDIEDHFVVVANIQTLAKVTDRVAKEFGCIIMDEAHHCPASTFTEVIDSSHARYRIALSGTMERTDGKHLLFKDYFGSKVLKPPKNNTIDPIVHVLETGLVLPGAGDQWVERMNQLMYDPEYQKLIAGIARKYSNLGYKTLTVADRTEFLDGLGSFLGEDCIVCHGEVKFLEGREEALKRIWTDKNHIAGSRQIFTEGISINILSCAILAQPSGNQIILEQLAGRIMRLCEEKAHLGRPVIVDIQFKGATAKRQNEERLAFYLSKGWEVKKI
jgi:superfamily II DNA or RNA helicase